VTKKNRIVELEPVPVGFVLGQPGFTNAEQVRGAITFLEGRVPPGKPRRFSARLSAASTASA
jgi:hypothetical protein